MNLEGLTEKRRGTKSLWYENVDGEIVAKRCTKCAENLVIDNFSKKKDGIGGRRSYCQNCEMKIYHKWYDVNKERCAENHRNWYGMNKERVYESNRKWKEANSERYDQYRRAWYETNREHVAEKKRNQYLSNKESYIERSRNWRLNNSELSSEYKLKWRIDNPDKVKESQRKWRVNNLEKMVLARQRRRAREKELPQNLTILQYAVTLDYFDNTCALTGLSDNLEMEHALPIACGHGGTTFGNCYPMSSFLNRSKNDSNIFEWFEANRQRFELSQERFDKLIEYLASANAMTVEEYRDYVYWCHANPRSINELEAQ